MNMRSDNPELSGGNNIRRALIVFSPVVLSLLVGMLAGFLQADSVKNWYPYLNKSALTPPDAVFPIAWTLLYIMMGLSIGRALLVNSSKNAWLKGLFVLQLFLNFTWCIVFFRMQNPLGGLICIFMLDAVVLWYTITVWPVRRSSAFLFIPYFLWVCFASYLNWYILLHN